MSFIDLDNPINLNVSNSLKWQSIRGADSTLESDEYFYATDLICEGPVEGLCDAYGSTLSYATPDQDNNTSDISLAKGIYYNNVPLLDTKLNKFNFLDAGFKINYGLPFDANLADYPSTVFRYSQKLYLNENSFVQHKGKNNSFTNAGIYFTSALRNFLTCFSNFGGNRIDYSNGKKTSIRFTDFNLNVIDYLDLAKENCNPFTHKIYNKHCDLLKVFLSIDNLFSIDDDGTQVASLTWALELLEENTSNRWFCVGNIEGISKGGYLVEMPINLNLNPINKNAYYLKIYILDKKVSPKNGKLALGASVSSIVECVTKKGEFNYPYSAVVKTGVSSKHFSQDPARSFDLKLLKVKVPNSYDPEARTYGIWGGDFSSQLKWTDNPAWIFYDICTNSRYGLGNLINDTDLNKWELLKIAKYCDELVKTNEPTRYAEDTFVHLGSNEVAISATDSKGVFRDYETFTKQYTPLSTLNIESIGDVTKINCNFFMWNLSYVYRDDKYVFESEKAFKGLIWQVKRGFLKYAVRNGTETYAYFVENITYNDGYGNFTTLNGETDGTHYKISLINDYGPTITFQKEDSGEMYNSFVEHISIPVDENATLRDKIDISTRNSQYYAKMYIAAWMNKYVKESIDQGGDLRSILDGPNGFFFDYNLIGFTEEIEDIISTIPIEDRKENGFIIYGKCIGSVSGERVPFEPRFTANILIDNETESLKLLNDIASIFRGMTYYKNELITSTIDVEKPITYLFNNSNVKDGSFTYTTGSTDGTYSVAKVLFKDVFENFSDSVEVVDDPQLVRDYGIVEHEILGFGITSRGQARRIAKWLLLTSKYENETVSFSTDIQGLLLKPGDIIQIEDLNKNYGVAQGRVTSVNYDYGYVTIDRKLNLNLVGKKMKFMSNKGDSIAEMEITKIENNSGKVYLSAPETKWGEIWTLRQISSSTVFAVSDTAQNGSELKHLYKIISIAETDFNEYAFYCMKYDDKKYSALDTNKVEDTETAADRQISYSVFDNLSEFNVPATDSAGGLYIPYEFDRLALTSDDIYLLDSLAFTSEKTFLDYSDLRQYNLTVLQIYFKKIKSIIDDWAENGDPNNSNTQYYTRAKEILNYGGGFLCKITHKSESIKFIVPGTNIYDQRFKFGEDYLQSNISADLKFYLYNKENQIVQLD